MYSVFKKLYCAKDGYFAWQQKHYHIQSMLLSAPLTLQYQQNAGLSIQTSNYHVHAEHTSPLLYYFCFPEYIIYSTHPSQSVVGQVISVYMMLY